MRTTTKLWVAFLAVWFLLATSGAWAQENSEAAKQAPIAAPGARVQTGPFYHLDFVVKEVEGNRVINSRSYSTSISKGGSSSIRTGARVPIVSNASAQTQFEYLDLGVNFDCRDLSTEQEGKLALKVDAEVSSIEPNEKVGPMPPTIRQSKWGAYVIAAIGKPTVIFSSDNVAGKIKLQVEMTATLIK